MERLEDPTGNTHDESPGASRPPRRGWNFSIRSLFVAITVLTLLAVNAMNLIELQQLRKDPAALRVRDRSKIHVRQLPYSRLGSVRYRLHIPEGQQCVLRVATEGITRDNFPEKYQERHLNGGEDITLSILEVRIPKDTENRIALNVRFEDRGLSHNLIEMILPSRENPWWTDHRLALQETETFDPEDEIALLRVGTVVVDSPNSAPSIDASASIPSVGVMVWIAPAPEKSQNK